MAAALALGMWGRPYAGCPGVGLARQQKGYPCVFFKLPIDTLHVMHIHFGRPSISSGPHYCPWLTSCHVAHLVKTKFQDVSHGGWWARIRTDRIRCVCACVGSKGEGERTDVFKGYMNQNLPTVIPEQCSTTA